MNGLDQFQNLENVDATQVAPAKTNDAAKAARKQALQSAMQQTMAEHGGEYLEIKGSKSAHVQVLNVLGFGETGGLIQTQKKTATAERAVAQAPKNVGYAIQNIGPDAISYLTEEFAPDADGKFVGSIVRKEMQPGEVVNISRKYLTLFCADPTISNKLANGKLVKTSAGGKAVPGNVNLDAELESYTFVFADKNISVNDESIKIQIGHPTETADGKKKYVVNDEYAAVFGYLNNETTATGKVKTSKPDLDSQDLAANFIYRLAKESGLA